MNNRFSATLEDIELLINDWWLKKPDELSQGDIRRFSSSLHLLLIQDTLGAAWRYFGFDKQPKIMAPNLDELLRINNLDIEHTIGCIAGGGCHRGIISSCIGAHRVDNPKTGVKKNANKGFSVSVGSYASLMPPSNTEQPSEIDRFTRYEFTLSEYVHSLSAIRIGQKFTRKNVIEYFRNYAGGAHYDSIKPSSERQSKIDYKALEDLDNHLRADTRSGLSFELLSIGQAVATSPDVRALVLAMKNKCTDHQPNQS